MQNNNHIKAFLVMCALVFFTAHSADGQNNVERILESVEANNLTLKAFAKGNEARSLEARMGNSLEDLSLDYGYKQGTSSGSSAWTHEFGVSQTFEMPWVYANRSKLARNKSMQFGAEYMALRQTILLEAKQIYMELSALYALREVIRYREEANERIEKLYSRKFETGDATALEIGKVQHETLLLNESVSSNGSRIAALESRLKALNGGQVLEMDFGANTVNTEELMPFEIMFEDYLTLSPDMELARLRETGACYDVKVSRSAASPKIDLGYMMERSADERFNGVTAGLSIPIFSNRHNVARARAEAQSAALEVESTEVELRAVLESLYRQAEVLKAALDRYGMYDTSPEYLRLLQKALELGEISIIDFYTESYSYYNVVELKIRLQFEYDMLIAEINSIYL